MDRNVQKPEQLFTVFFTVQRNRTPSLAVNAVERDFVGDSGNQLRIPVGPNFPDNGASRPDHPSKQERSFLTTRPLHSRIS